MAKLPARLAAGRAIPWLTVLELGREVVKRGQKAYGALTESERVRLRRLLNSSKGRPSNLPEHERHELMALAWKAAKAAARAP